MAGSCSRASAFASCRNRASMPGVQAISGWSTLHARRRSRSLSHSSYTSAKPPRPIRRFTSYLGPSARARRSAVGTAGGAPGGGGAAGAPAFLVTVGEAAPADQALHLVLGTERAGETLRGGHGGRSAGGGRHRGRTLVRDHGGRSRPARRAEGRAPRDLGAA